MKRTYGRLIYSANHWVMADAPPHVAIVLKNLFPRLAKTAVGPFTFQCDDTHCANLEWFMIRYPMEMTDDDRARLTGGRLAFEGAQAELERIMSPEWKPAAVTGYRPGYGAREYQSQASEMAVLRRALLLGDGVGLGKTISAIDAFLKPGSLPAACVVQTHLQNQWKERIEEFTFLRVHKVKVTKPYSLPPADVYLFKYTQLAGWVDFFATGFFNSVTYDEPQELRTGDASSKGQGAYVLSDAVEEKDGFKLGLTATPIFGYGAEIWNVMRAIDQSVLGPRADFHREWTNGDSVIKDPAALGSYLREQHVFLRRLKGDPGVNIQTPASSYMIETIPSDGDAIKNIDTVARALALRTMTGSFTERGQAGRELDMMARQATGIGKAKYVAAYVRILLESGVPVLLAGWHREFWRIVNEELKEFNPLMYTGSESPTKKERNKKAFMNRESLLMEISLKSGAGLDGIQHVCSAIVVGELGWSKAEIDTQLVGHLDRDGQKEPVNAIFLVSEDGSDPPMMELLGLKASQSAGIVDPDKPFETQNRDRSRIQALAEQFLSKKEIQAAKQSATDTAFVDIPDDPGEVPVADESVPARVQSLALERAIKALHDYGTERREEVLPVILESATPAPRKRVAGQPELF